MTSSPFSTSGRHIPAPAPTPGFSLRLCRISRTRSAWIRRTRSRRRTSSWRCACSSRSTGAPSRLEQAQSAAIRLRNGIPEVPSGTATLTTDVLPQLLPTADVPTFDSTVERVLAIEQPPPPILGYGTLGTSFGPLSYVRGQGYFGPAAKHRLIVLLTDGESAPYDPAATAAALTQPSNASPFSGIQTQTDAPISLVIVRLGAPSDHVYAPNGTIDAAYRAEPHAAAIVSTLAAQARGGAYTQSSLGSAGRA